MASSTYLTRQQDEAIATCQEVSRRRHLPASHWKRQLAAAKTAWARLSVAELLRSGGREQSLIDLVEERYATTREEAGRQVQRFILRQAS